MRYNMITVIAKQGAILYAERWMNDEIQYGFSATTEHPPPAITGCRATAIRMFAAFAGNA
jgi:hypothetical protein